MNAYQNFKDTANAMPFNKLASFLGLCAGVNNCSACWDWDDCLEMFDQRAEYIDVFCPHCGRKVAGTLLCPVCGGRMLK